MRNETLVWVNEKDNVLGYRNENELPFLHRVSLIIPKTYNGFIISRRAKDKEPFPDTWVCAVGGKVNAGELYVETALREMREEGGINLDSEDLKYVTKFLYNKEDYQAHFRIFTTHKPFSLENFKLDKSEVQFIKDFYLDEISEMIEKTPDEFAPTFREAIIHFNKFV